MTKALIVIQRYGQEIVGGAETHCRQVAEKLVQELGWSVTVFTSCATDYMTWKNDYPPGKEEINGVTVRRFPVLFPRDGKIFGSFHHSVIHRLAGWRQKTLWKRWICYWLERVWLILQGPYSPTLVRAIRREAENFDKVIFFTYLYHPTLMGARQLPKGSFSLIPTAHNEPPFYFQHTAQLLESCGRILVNIKAEADLIQNAHGLRPQSMEIAGLGYDVPDGTGDGLGPDLPQRYFLYLGRISEGKGLRLLIDTYLSWRKNQPDTAPSLVLVGKKDEVFDMPVHPHVIYLGFVDEKAKFRILRSALAIINPSQFESMSMIAIEAMISLKPIVLNQNSEVLDYYCQNLKTALGFRSQDELATRLGEVSTIAWDHPDRKVELEESKAWAESHYSWPAVLKAYQRAPEVKERRGSQLIDGSQSAVRL